MKRVVLDASALVAFYENEPGADKVEELVREAMEGKKELLMSVVNWGEVYYSRWHKGGQEAADRVRAEVDQLPIEIVDANRDLTELAAEFRVKFHLPYADCFAAALAAARKGILSTADKDFKLVQDQIHVQWL